MTALADEMAEAMLTLAGARQAYDTRESMLARAARRAGISYRQAKSFFYREAANPAARAVDQVRAALERQAYDARSDLERIRHLEAEVAALRGFVEATLGRMASASPAEAGRSGAHASVGALASTHRQSIGDRTVDRDSGVAAR